MQLNGKGRAVPISIEPYLEPPAKAQDEHALPIKDVLEVLWRRLWTIALVVFVVVVLVVGFDLLQTPDYEASIKILVGQEGNKRDLDNLGGDVAGLQDVTKTVAEVLPTRPVAEDTVQQLGLDMTPDEILGSMNVAQAQDTQVINVSYKDSDPEEAQQIVNTFGAAFSDRVSEISPSASSLTATVWEEATVPESPVSPNPLRDLFLALILGGTLGVGLAFLLEHLDDRWRSLDEVEQISGVPTFGTIRKFETSKDKNKESSNSPAPELPRSTVPVQSSSRARSPGPLPSGLPESTTPPQSSRRARRERRARKRGLISWFVSG